MEVCHGQTLDVASSQCLVLTTFICDGERENVLAKYPVAHPVLPGPKGVEGARAGEPGDGVGGVSALCYRSRHRGREAPGI